jgi:tRNA-methyltransferase O
VLGTVVTREVYPAASDAPLTERSKAACRSTLTICGSSYCLISEAVEVFEPWLAALDRLAQFERIEVLYWLHLARRDLVMRSPANDGTSRGTFSLRSPARPNPIGTSIAELVSIEGAIATGRGLDCLEGDRCSISSGIANCSSRSRRLNREISRSAIRRWAS